MSIIIYFDGVLDNYYFRDAEHKQNFIETIGKWPEVRNDCEYRAACYILSVPMIYQKVSKHLPNFKEPVDWIWKWEVAHNEEFREEKGFVGKFEAPFSLSGSMIQLGRLALHLWDGYKLST